MDSTTKLPTRLMVITDQLACECRCLFSPSLACLSLRLALDGLLSLGPSLKHTFKSVWFLVLVPANPTLTTIPMLMLSFIEWQAGCPGPAIIALQFWTFLEIDDNYDSLNSQMTKPSQSFHVSVGEALTLRFV